ncbi:DUF2235 domain-containing protein [Providencia rettgeri]|uniref:DUF2235 domain-containing protein n=1 Tax=Providencia rettgeri TaxID=587 RepID=UPI001CFE94A4|nr:DUF2235 domain-containing protein [Providencia rettgeri]MCB4839236.1 DUF2235 domain-containing protein [Providencia rettgeri]
MSRRAGQAEEYNLGNCSSVLHLGYFFDGTGRNVEQDAPEGRRSNIARLFRAYPEDGDDTDVATYKIKTMITNKESFNGLVIPISPLRQRF